PDPTPEPVHVISGSESNNFGLYGDWGSAVAAAKKELNRQIMTGNPQYRNYTIVTVYYSDGSEKYALTLS
ncbi:hypothetical protein, partial [Latilactobacillus graminis]|uniref:hypothetical protein n=1 Tax=Latilactobacillus graminis TaxID=60519 RepID=UPI000AF204CA